MPKQKPQATEELDEDERRFLEAVGPERFWLLKKIARHIRAGLPYPEIARGLAGEGATYAIVRSQASAMGVKRRPGTMSRAAVAAAWQRASKT